MSLEFQRHCALAAALAVILASKTAGAATLEQETVAHMDQLRAITAGQTDATRATYNAQMDAGWKFYKSHGQAIFPILRTQFKAEIDRAQPSDLVLLDTGLFEYENDGAEGKTLARDALFHLNSSSAVIAENWDELFELTHAVAEDHDPRVLDFIDRSFLASAAKIFVPQHSLRLDGTLICVFLYGAFGPDAEAHLAAKLQDRAVMARILEVLGWLGSPSSVRSVGEALAGSPDYETLSRVTSFMMQTAGPQGREFMLNLDPEKLDSRSREYLTKIRPAVEAMSFDVIKRTFEKAPGDQKLADSDVEKRLAAMTANAGKDDHTSPVAILDSGIGADSLIKSLTTIRALTFHGISDEALSDVETTNAVINALRYRGH